MRAERFFIPPSGRWCLPMSLPESVRAFAAIELGAIGLSHVLAHRAWARFFIGLREKGDPGVLFVGLAATEDDLAVLDQVVAKLVVV